jgi:uncharacterized protein (DUF885 family)
VKVLPTAVAVLLVSACGPVERPDRPVPIQEPSPQALQESATAFHTLRDAFLEWYYEAHPVRASELGVRAHDARMPGMDRASVQRRIDALLDWQAQLRQIPARLMRDDDRYDHAVLDFGVRGELLELEEIRRWASDPWRYTDLIARGLSTVADHAYDAPSSRATSLRGRLEAAPAVLAAARSNLRTPPGPWTQRALEHGAQLLEYVETELPDQLAGGTVGAGEWGGVEEARQGLVAALREHLRWLESDLLPVSTGEYRLGRYLFARQLLYNEHVSLTLEELDRLNEENIAAYQERIRRTAAEIDPARSVRAVMDSLTREQGSPQGVVPAARAVMMEARDWVIASNLVSISDAAVPGVRESPAFARHERASLTVAGAMDGRDGGAFFNVTPPMPEWLLAAATLHETFPGRYLYEQRARAGGHELRRVFVPRSVVEGWSQYGEQVMMDEGFRTDDPAARLGQLRRALDAHVRWYAALHLHAFNRPESQVIGRMVELMQIDEAGAQRELARAGHELDLLAPAFGRVQLLELRSVYEDRARDREGEFSLREFHDRLLELSLPLPLAAEALMPTPSQRPAAHRVRPNRGEQRVDW